MSIPINSTLNMLRTNPVRVIIDKLQFKLSNSSDPRLLKRIFYNWWSFRLNRIHINNNKCRKQIPNRSAQFVTTELTKQIFKWLPLHCLLTCSAACTFWHHIASSSDWWEPHIYNKDSLGHLDPKLVFILKRMQNKKNN